MPKTSILLPTYNGERYLPDQLRSISDQTDGDFEVIVIDDGSTDGTRAVVARHAAADSRFRVVGSSGNHGQKMRLIEGFDLAAGAYISFADQDDVWDRDRNRLLVEALDAGAGMAFGTSDLIDDEGRSLGTDLLTRLSHRFEPADRLRYLFESMFSAHGTAMRRELFNKAAFYQLFPFDWAFGLDAVFADAIAYRPASVVHHRMHGGNQMNRISFGGRTRFPTMENLRGAFLYRRFERFILVLVLEYLSRSPILDQARREAFATAALAARHEWLGVWRSLRGGSKAYVTEGFAPLFALAGSPSDLAYFRERLFALSGMPLGYHALREGRRKLRLIRSH